MRASTVTLALIAGLSRREQFPEVRFGLVAQWWPGRGPLGLALHAEGGPVSSQDRLRAHVRRLEAGVRAAASVRVRLGNRFWLAAEAGPGLHGLRLWGTLQAVRGVPVDVTRLVPALGAGLRGDWLIAPALSLGLWVDAGWLLRVQRYYVDGERVLETARLRAGVGLSLGLVLD